MKLKVVLQDADGDDCCVSVPAAPGCVDQGDSWSDVLSNIRVAIECYRDLDAPMEPAPEYARVEEVEV